jgi:hypothetical protein
MQDSFSKISSLEKHHWVGANSSAVPKPSLSIQPSMQRVSRQLSATMMVPSMTAAWSSLYSRVLKLTGQKYTIITKSLRYTKKQANSLLSQ